MPQITNLNFFAIKTRINSEIKTKFLSGAYNTEWHSVI